MNPKIRKLENGKIIPLIGLGTSRMINPEEVIYYSIKDGVRLIDTASDYYNEENIGIGIKRALDEGICRREDLTIIGKIWVADKNDPETALRKTLRNLNLKYIDFYLDHYPTTKDYLKNKKGDLSGFVSIYDFWPKMEKLVDKGLAKSIGVSNYNVQSLSNLLSFCRIKPAIMEVEYNLYFIQKNLKDFCDKVNIALIAYYPLPYGNCAKKRIKEKPEFYVFENKLIKELSIKYNATPGQIILNWHIKNGIIPIPGTSKINRMKENLKALDINMAHDDVERLSHNFRNLGTNRFCECKRFFGIDLFA